MSFINKFAGRVGEFLDEVTIPEEAHRAHEEALLALDQQDPERALVILRIVAERFPQVQRTFVLMARAHKARRQWHGAWQAYDRALAIKESAQLHLRAGECMEHLGQLHDAEKHFRQGATCKDYPELEFEISYALGRVYAGLSRLDKAERELGRAHRIKPDHLESGHALVRVVGRRDAAEALRLLNGLNRVAQSPATDVLRGTLEEELGHDGPALNAYERALEHGEVTAILGAARLFMKQERLEDAEKLLLKVPIFTSETTLERTEKIMFFRTSGILALRRNNFEGAAENFQRALEMAPDDGESLIGLGRVEMQRGNFEVAGGHFQRALGVPNFRDQALVWLGAWHSRRDDFGAARHLLEEAYRDAVARPTRVDALVELGHVAQKTGDAAEAAMYFQEASSLAPERRNEFKPLVDASFEQLRYRWTNSPNPQDPLALARLLEEMLAWLSTDARLGGFVPAAQALLRQLDSPLSLAIVGEFNAGKSTLLNAILGEDLLPMGILPTTAHQGVVRFGPRRAARVFFVEGAPEIAREVDFEEASRLMRENAEEISRIEFIFPHPALRAVEFWDTPGFNAVEERHEEVARRALERAEAILWVMDANQVLSQTQFELIDRVKNGAERILVVINKIDRLSQPQDVQELVDYVQEHIGSEIAGVFPLSAMRAREGTSTDFDAFKEYLEERVISRAGQLKVLEVGGLVRELFVEIDAFGFGRLATIAQAQQVIDDTRVWLETNFEKSVAHLEEECRKLDDRVTNLLAVFEREVSETLRPSGQIIQRLSLSEEDADFLARLLVERTGGAVTPSQQVMMEIFGSLETGLAQRLEPVFRALDLQESRALQRRAEGYSDEGREARKFLVERLSGHIVAEARGRAHAAGRPVLVSLEGLDRSLWRGNLRRLLPDVTQTFERESRSWATVWRERTEHFLTRLRGDLELLEEETRHTFDVSQMIED